WSTSVKGCAHCDQPDCVVLATIAGYVVGSKIIDVPTPPDSAPAGSVTIDNSTHRHILPSAELIQSVIKCILEKGAGGGGTGPQGPPGKGIDEVKATFVPCQQPGKAALDESG